jgi:hypothetical protein
MRIHGNADSQRRGMFAGLVAPVAVCLLAGCGGENAPSSPVAISPVPPPARDTIRLMIVAAYPSYAVANPGTPVFIAPVVRVRDPSGNSVAGARVRFVVATGGGSVADSVGVTDGQNGDANCGQWILGANPGANTLVASVDGGSSVTFTAIGRPSTIIARYALQTVDGQTLPAAERWNSTTVHEVLSGFYALSDDSTFFYGYQWSNTASGVISTGESIIQGTYSRGDSTIVFSWFDGSLLSTATTTANGLTVAYQTLGADVIEAYINSPQDPGARILPVRRTSGSRIPR